MNNEERAREWIKHTAENPFKYHRTVLASLLDEAEARERKKCAVLIRELRAALADFLGGEFSYACKFVHHAKRDMHTWSEQCPIMTRYRALLVDDAKEKSDV